MATWTYSKLRTFKTCPKQFWFSYEENLKPKVPDEKLIIGKEVHRGIESMYHGATVNEAFEEIYNDTQDMLEEVWDEEHEKEITMTLVKIREMLDGFKEFVVDPELEDPDVEILDVESQFSIPFTDVDGNEHTFEGKMDIVKRTPNGVWIEDHKTASAWGDGNLLKLDDQGTLYVTFSKNAISHLDEQVRGMRYNVLKKPTIKLRQNETVDEYRERLHGDMRKRPDFYFITEWSTRNEQQLHDVIDELRFVAAQAEREDMVYYRNPTYVSFGHCSTMCSYTDICIHDSPEEREMQYEEKADVHEELEDDGAVNPFE